MTQTLDLANVREFLTRHFIDIFDTMLSMKAIPAEKTEVPHHGARVSGSVGFAGENMNGVLYIHVSASFAKQVAATMMGVTPEEVKDEHEVNDVIGEVSNMVTGGLKSWMCDIGTDCAMSTPAIIRGNSFSIEPMEDVQRDLLVFDCGTEKVIVEIHIKIN